MARIDTKTSLHRLRVVTVVLLVLMAFQGWLGDTVNLFAVFPSGGVSGSFHGFVQAVLAVGPVLIIHVLNAFLLLILGIVLAVLILMRTNSRGAKIASVLGAWSILSAMIGGILFVLSGFTNNAYSAQMGGSFIAAYAMYFVTLYFLK